MLSTLMIVVSVTAASQDWPVTPADVSRCVQSNAEKLSASNETAAVVADRAVAACAGLLVQLSAARDAVTARDAGAPVPAWNSAQWRASVTNSFRHSALQDVVRACRSR
jgi:hypothetical protein